MSKKKHSKKNLIVPRSDANQSVKESLAEKERVRLALIKRQEKLREEYEAEMKRRREMYEKLSMSAVTPTPETPKLETPKETVKKDVSEIKAINAINPAEEE